MPGVEEEEGGDEPEDVGAEEGYDKRVEDLVLDEVAEVEFVEGELRLYGFYGYED